MTEADIDKEFDEIIDLINRGVDVEENAFYLSNFDEAAYKRYYGRANTNKKGLENKIKHAKEYQPFKEKIERVKNGENLTEQDFGDSADEFAKNARRYSNEVNADAYEYAQTREMLENLGLSDDEVSKILDEKYKDIDGFDILETKRNKDGSVNSKEFFDDIKNNNRTHVDKDQYYRIYKKNKKQDNKYNRERRRNRTKGQSQTQNKTKTQKYKEFKSDIERYKELKEQNEIIKLGNEYDKNNRKFDHEKRKRNFEERKTKLERRMNNPNLSDRERIAAQNELYRIEELESLKNGIKDPKTRVQVKERYLEEYERLEELKRKANDPNISKKERKKAQRELAKESNNPFLYDDDLLTRSEIEELEVKGRLETTDRDVVETFLEHEHKINKNAADYDQFMKDLDLAGRDFVDAKGNELSDRSKKFNKKTRKMGLKIKGFITGDYSDYNEYIEAVERLENMGPRNFDRYDIDNLFNSNGHLNNVDDLDNIHPTRTVSAKESFERWQKQRMYNNLFGSANVNATKGVHKNTRGVAAAKEAVLKSAPNAKKLFTVQGTLGVGLNLFNAKATYDEERKEGRGVFGSLARAGVDFALGEVLGMKYMGLMAAQAAPRMAVKGVEGLGKLTREKNNMQRHEAFGYASFQDTQQLATMRQSGMEMAKMANYNLQQTLMGNEAKYMHR